MGALVVVALGACEPGVSINVQLSAADPELNTESILSMNIVLDDVSDELPAFFHPIDAGDFAFNEQQVLQDVRVDKDSSLAVEVWGCTEDACGQADVDFRGCTAAPLDVAAAGSETLVVQIVMFDVGDDALDRCPVLQLQ